MKVSVVVPVYHNAPSLPILHERLGSVATQTPQAEFEFLFVDDGSSDNSFDVLKGLAHKDRRVRVLRLVRNFGSNAAILAGLTYATGDCAVAIAADLQDPPELIHEMVLRWCDGNPVVLAARSERHEPLLTRLYAGLFNRLFRRVVFPNFPPNGFDFFLVDRRVVDVLVKMPERNAYLMGLLLWAGFPSITLSYAREDRPFGRSQWTFSKKIKYFIDAFAGFSYLPLRLASITGVLLALAGLCYAVFVVATKIIGGFPVEGWASLMVVLLILSGTQMVMLGILGEYLWRTLDQVRSRPLFLVAESVGAPATNSSEKAA